MTHRPKGRMCAECLHARRDCSALPFASMPAIGLDADGIIVVRCAEYQKEIAA